MLQTLHSIIKAYWLYALWILMSKLCVAMIWNEEYLQWQALFSQAYDIPGSNL